MGVTKKASGRDANLPGRAFERAIYKKKKNKGRVEERINSLTSLCQSLPGSFPLQNRNTAGIGHFAEC